jgi:hypothetical protein
MLYDAPNISFLLQSHRLVQKVKSKKKHREYFTGIDSRLIAVESTSTSYKKYMFIYSKDLNTRSEGK